MSGSANLPLLTFLGVVMGLILGILGLRFGAPFLAVLGAALILFALGRALLVGGGPGRKSGRGK